MALQYLMTVHELTELLTPVHWVWSAGIANPNQQWCALRGGFHTLGGGIDPGDLRFCPRFFGVVEIWKDI